MSKFVSVGLHIRKLHPGFIPSTSADAWEYDDILFEYVKTEFGLYQNCLQLLDSENEINIKKLGSFILPRDDVVLISLDILKTTLDVETTLDIIKFSEEVHLPAEWKWEILGLDVFDINGFYSYLEMTNPDKFTLFQEEQLLDALILCEEANIAERQHSPFAVARLRKLISI